MEEFKPYTKYIVIFRNVREVIQSEHIIKSIGFPYQVVPVPSKYSTECGMCIELEGQFLSDFSLELNKNRIQYNIYQK